MNIKEAAIRYLENRPRTCGEMRKKLMEKGFSAGEIEKTIGELLELNYLNDREYVVAYLNYGFSKGKGIKLIRYELYDKGVSNNDIEDGMFDYEEEYGYDFQEDEKERALKQACKVLEDRIMDEKLKAKIARRLSSKGFEQQVIWSVIGELTRDNPEM